MRLVGTTTMSPSRAAKYTRKRSQAIGRAWAHYHPEQCRPPIDQSKPRPSGPTWKEQDLGRRHPEAVDAIMETEAGLLRTYDGDFAEPGETLVEFAKRMFPKGGRLRDCGRVGHFRRYWLILR